MQYAVLFVAIVILGVALVVGFRPRHSAPVRLETGTPILGLSEPDPVLPPVLLPEHPTGEDVDQLRLAPALRGYRCDQVDAVLDALGAEIDALRAQIPAAPLAPSDAEAVESGEADDVDSSEADVVAVNNAAAFDSHELDVAEPPLSRREARLAAQAAESGLAEEPLSAPAEAAENPFDEAQRPQKENNPGL